MLKMNDANVAAAAAAAAAAKVLQLQFAASCNVLTHFCSGRAY